MLAIPSLLGWLRGLWRIALALIFAVEEIGLERGQVELSRRLVNQEPDLGLGVILQLGIDPFDGFFQSLLHEVAPGDIVHDSWFLVHGSKRGMRLSP